MYCTLHTAHHTVHRSRERQRAKSDRSRPRDLFPAVPLAAAVAARLAAMRPCRRRRFLSLLRALSASVLTLCLTGMIDTVVGIVVVAGEGARSDGREAELGLYEDLATVVAGSGSWLRSDGAERIEELSALLTGVSARFGPVNVVGFVIGCRRVIRLQAPHVTLSVAPIPVIEVSPSTPPKCVPQQ